jgi:hypothetical protein
MISGTRLSVSDKIEQSQLMIAAVTGSGCDPRQRLSVGVTPYSSQFLQLDGRDKSGRPSSGSKSHTVRGRM